MKKLYPLFFLIFVVSVSGFSAHISLEKARKVAHSYLLKNASGAYRSNFNLTALNAPNSLPYYVFNYQHGFIIVSSDDAATPILAYSTEKPFQFDNQPIQVKKWLENYQKQLEFIIINKIPASPEITLEWLTLINSPKNLPLSKIGGISAVNPLVSTIWDQAPYYNALCPYDNGAAERTVTGCVATSMAQIMKFWSYPTKGSGFHNYNHPYNGSLSANFGATTYNWASMPNEVTSSNSAVATLMYHCGVSVDMEYGPSGTGGSSAYPDAIPVAFTTYFGYSSTAQVINRSSYTDATWISKLKTELNAGRPMEYHGFGNGGGHSFVCDGYDNSNNFHFNWGWDGLANGYYSINALNPSSVGYGGGLGSYNSNQGAVIGIKPPSGSNPTHALTLNSAISASPGSTITYGNGFSVTANIVNTGTGSFAGDYTAALFRSDGTFVDYIQTKTGQSLNAGYTYTAPGLTFTTAGITAANPGSYHVYIYYRPTGGSWSLLNGGSYTNDLALTIQGTPNNLQLFSAINVSTSPIIIGQSFTVSVNLKNEGGSAFNGYVSVDLHDINGSWIKTINFNNSVSIGAGANSVINFNSNVLTNSAGSYYLAVWSGADVNSAELTGSAYFANPITVQLQPPALLTDIYESNNTYNSAYNFPLNLISGQQTVSTSGSTLHNGADLDYYYVTLPSSMDYTIGARVHDSYNSGNGNTYTADVMFSYDDGSGFTESFDDEMPDNIYVYGGNTDVTFLVAPYFSGETGTYLLEFTVYEGIVANTNSALGKSVPALIVYPNPANQIVNINTSNIPNVSKISIVSTMGQEVFHATNPSLGITTVDCSGFSSGIYTVKVDSKDHTFYSKITVR